jgi:acetyltransferase-like isoleucine patch superfamily enzyme
MGRLKDFLAKIGLNTARPSRTFMINNPEYRGFSIGEWTYGHPHVPRGDDGTTLRIGRFCSFASGVTILTGCNHRTDWISTYPFQHVYGPDRPLPFPSRSKGDVMIGHDVWVGVDALILSGVTIGNGAVIAARSVVTKDVPPYAIVAGSPARVVKYRFDEDTIAVLLAIAWWDWPQAKIEEALPLLMSPNLDTFIRRYGAPQP